MFFFFCFFVLKNIWVNYLFVQSFNKREILAVRVNGDDCFIAGL